MGPAEPYRESPRAGDLEAALPSCPGRLVDVPDPLVEAAPDHPGQPGGGLLSIQITLYMARFLGVDDVAEGGALVGGRPPHRRPPTGPARRRRAVRRSPRTSPRRSSLLVFEVEVESRAEMPTSATSDPQAIVAAANRPRDRRVTQGPPSSRRLDDSGDPTSADRDPVSRARRPLVSAGFFHIRAENDQLGLTLESTYADVAQLVERKLPKLEVAGSNPVVRFACRAKNPVCGTSRSPGVGTGVGTKWLRRPQSGHPGSKINATFSPWVSDSRRPRSSVGYPL